MGSNKELRRSLHFLLDKLGEIEAELPEVEKNKADPQKRGYFERLILKGCEAMKRTKLNSPDYRQFRDIGNSIRHKLDTDLDHTLEQIKNCLPTIKEFSITQLNDVLSPNKAFRSFETFGNVGTHQDRAKLIDTLLDRLSEKDRTFWGKFPQNPGINNLTTQIEEIIAHPDLIKLTQDNHAIATQVTEEIANWGKELYKNIAKKSPYVKEEGYFSTTQKHNTKEFLTQYENIAQYLRSIYKKGEINFDFFGKKLNGIDSFLDPEMILRNNIIEKLPEANKSHVSFKDGVGKFIESNAFDAYEKRLTLPFNKQNYKEYAENKAKEALGEAKALHQNFMKDWQKSLLEKKQRFEIAEIDKSRKAFIEYLYERVGQFNKLKGLIEPFTKDLGRLWDMSAGVWKNAGFVLLQKYAVALEHDKAILELADMLGSYRKAEKIYEEVELEKVVVRPRFKPKHAAKGEVVGIRESDDISSMLPIEAATLANPATKMIFYKKFAEKKLTTYNFTQQFGDMEEKKQKETQLKEKEEGKGPIIICVDTSGSMHGTPEQVAKTVCFALTKIALADKRKCFLISFSTQIQTTELTDLQSSLDKLIDFLGMSFNGGTDANPALMKSLQMLETNEYKKADVLVVSDFVMGELSKDVVEKIDTAKINKTKFHSLTISDSANVSVINQFDHNWSYNIKGDKQNEALVKQIRSVV